MRSRAWPGSCRRPCSGARRRCSRRRSRSPGPACRRRSGRRSRPRRAASGCVVELGLEAAVAPVQEHGDAVRVAFAVARSGLPSPFRSPIATDEAAAGWVVALGLEAAVAPVEEHGDAVRVGSRSPGPACRRRSGRRSRPSEGRVRLRSRAWAGSCRRPCSGARRRFRVAVRGRQVRLAVAVQVADRDRLRAASGCVAPRGGERRRRGPSRRTAPRRRASAQARCRREGRRSDERQCGSTTLESSTHAVRH